MFSTFTEDNFILKVELKGNVKSIQAHPWYLLYLIILDDNFNKINNYKGKKALNIKLIYFINKILLTLKNIQLNIW